TALDSAEVEVHTLHSPLSQKPEQVKVRTLETLFEDLAAPSTVPRILTGDLNTPQYESREGAIQTFARTRTGRIRPHYGERHDPAARGHESARPREGVADRRLGRVREHGSPLVLADVGPARVAERGDRAWRRGERAAEVESVLGVPLGLAAALEVDERSAALD